MEAPVRARLLKRPRQPSLGGQQQQQEEHELDRASSALLSRRKYLKKTAKGKVLKGPSNPLDPPPPPPSALTRTAHTPRGGC